MERVRFIEHRGRRILLQDFSGITDPDEALATIDEAIAFVDELTPDGSLLVLTITLGSHYNREVMDGLKALGQHHTPYIRASAVVTDSGLHRVGIWAVSKFTGREIESFSDPEKAKDWLVGQVES